MQVFYERIYYESYKYKRYAFSGEICKMGRNKDISPRKKAVILGLLNNLNVSQREIARLTGVSVATVNRVKACFDKNNSVLVTKRENCRSNRKTTPRSERKIAQICSQNRRASTRVLLHKVKEAEIDISERTLRRRIKELGFACHRPAKKPRLTPNMIKKRLEWAKVHRHWTNEDWEKVCWNFQSF